jgi:hypothetical protein
MVGVGSSYGVSSVIGVVNAGVVGIGGVVRILLVLLV